MHIETQAIDGSRSARGRLRVMIATDGSDASCAAVQEATRILPADADFFLVNVLDAVEDPMESAGGLEGPVLDAAEELAQRRESWVDAEGALARCALAFGPTPIGQRVVERNGLGVGARICAVAADENASVVVIGSHGHRAIVDVLLGSVGNYVLHHSPCPVLVVRHTAS